MHHQMQDKFLDVWNQKKPSLKFCSNMTSLAVTVLTRTARPPNLHAMDFLRLPDAIEQCKSTFYYWYKSQNKKRELSYHWIQSSDEFCTKNMYEFLQVIIKQLNIARTDIYLFFLNTMTRENKTIGIINNK